MVGEKGKLAIFGKKREGRNGQISKYFQYGNDGEGGGGVF